MTKLHSGKSRTLLLVGLGMCLLAPMLSFARLHEAGSERADLKIPTEIMERACANVGYKGMTLGFSADQMANFSGDKLRLRIVENLFRDAVSLPRVSGNLSDMLLAKYNPIETGVSVSFSLLGVSAAGGITAPTETTWAVSWIPDSATVDEAFDAVLNHGKEKGIGKPVGASDRKALDQLPDGVRRLVTRLLIAAVEATPELRQAYDIEFLAENLGVKDVDQASRQELYTFGAFAFLDTSAIVPSAAFQAFDRVDLGYMALGSSHYFQFANAALDEFGRWQDSTETDLSGLTGCSFESPAGLVLISGAGPDTVSGDYSLVIDLGGDDCYVGSTAVPRSFAYPIGVVVDLAGNDTYDPGEERAALACGNHGIGAIFDLAGDDTYKCGESGIGSAWYGTGAVVDYEGNDSYATDKAYSIAAAHAGVGLLFDLDGDDTYASFAQSQGYGGPLGVGLLYDASGNDKHTVEGLDSEVWGDNPVSLSLGAGFGRRADFGDGHSLAGGIGVLIDGAGDDEYQAHVFTLGSGYWWGLGMFEDCAGNDTYNSTFYSFGGAAHYALGCMVDRSGNDKYNVGKDKNGIGFGHGRDGSIGVFFDGDGDDQYNAGLLGEGGANLNSIGLFWDRRGNDTYGVPDSLPNMNNLIFGSGSKDTDVSRSFRNGIPEVGIFLDTQGKDSYEQFPIGEHHKARDNGIWRHNTGPRTWGFGWDTNWYEPAKGEKTEIQSSGQTTKNTNEDTEHTEKR